MSHSTNVCHAALNLTEPTRGPSRRESCCAAQTRGVMLAVEYFDRSAETVRHRSPARPRRM
jgi:hypothetical protein